MVEKEELFELLRACISTRFNTIDDRRIPAPDVKGVLADYQIRRQQLDDIAREISENWPGVHEVRAGAYNDGPYFAIYLNPFSRDIQKQHWPLADKINSIINNNNNFSYFFLPKMEQSPYSSKIMIYNIN